jgi:hypothetical protein
VGPQSFDPRPLPPSVAAQLRGRLGEAHRAEPFSTLQPRATAQRVVAIVERVGLQATLYRGGVDLRGSEADHVWLGGAVPPDVDTPAYVVDVAYPLFAEEFLATLRAFVAGDAPPERLAEVAAGAGLEDRVLGVFPEPVRYLGTPVWSARSA